MLETLIATHCGPALAGIKSASTVTVFNDKILNLEEKTKKLNKELNRKNIYIKILCKYKKSALLIVYRKTALEKRLNDENVKNFLESYGYSLAETVEQHLKILSNHLGNSEFPHEIGAFLGYPMDDVYRFINHRNKGCLLTGIWKVYSDKENAIKMFMRYKECTCEILNRLNNGKSLAQIFCADA